MTPPVSPLAERFWPAAPGLAYLTRAQARAIAAVAVTGNQRRAADMLGISVNTLKNCLTAVFDALNVVGTVAALRRLGWTDGVPLELLDLPDMPDEVTLVRIGGVQ